MIREIGCNNDGSVWMSLFIEVGKDQYTAIIPMTSAKATEVRDAMTKAIDEGQRWLISGVHPDGGNGKHAD